MQGVYRSLSSERLAGILLILLTHTTFLHASNADDPKVTAKLCGPNVLYLFLRLHGVDVALDQVMQYLPSDKEGMSLLEVKSALADFGIDAEVLKCSADDLRKLTYPAIARIPRRGYDLDGHYILCCEMLGDHSIVSIDGTTAERHVTKLSDIRNEIVWHVIRARPAVLVTGADVVTVALGSCGLICIFATFRRRRRTVLQTTRDTGREQPDQGAHLAP